MFVLLLLLLLLLLYAWIWRIFFFADWMILLSGDLIMTMLEKRREKNGTWNKRRTARSHAQNSNDVIDWLIELERRKECILAEEYSMISLEKSSGKWWLKVFCMTDRTGISIFTEISHHLTSCSIAWLFKISISSFYIGILVMIGKRVSGWNFMKEWQVAILNRFI